MRYSGASRVPTSRHNPANFITHHSSFITHHTSHVTIRMKNVFTIFKREFLGYFRSPVAYVFLVVFLMASVGLAW